MWLYLGVLGGPRIIGKKHNTPRGNSLLGQHAVEQSGIEQDSYRLGVVPGKVS